MFPHYVGGEIFADLVGRFLIQAQRQLFSRVAGKVLSGGNAAHLRLGSLPE